MSNIKRIYANGCSFTYDNHIQHDLGQLCYPEILAQRYGISCTNAGRPGSCNRRIIRNTLRDSLSFDNTTLILLQLTFLFRTEKPYTPGQNNEWKMAGATEEYHESIKNNPLEKINQQYFETYLRFFDPYAELTNLAADIIMLTGYLRSKQIPYFIFPYTQLTIGTTLLIGADQLQQYLAQDPAVLNILTDSLTDRLGAGDWYYDAAPGHLNVQGHHQAANTLEKLIPTINDAQE
jgi:hypothetical protein